MVILMMNIHDTSASHQPSLTAPNTIPSPFNLVLHRYLPWYIQLIVSMPLKILMTPLIQIIIILWQIQTMVMMIMMMMMVVMMMMMMMIVHDVDCLSWQAKQPVLTPNIMWPTQIHTHIYTHIRSRNLPRQCIPPSMEWHTVSTWLQPQPPSYFGLRWNHNTQTVIVYDDNDGDDATNYDARITSIDLVLFMMIMRTMVHPIIITPMETL